MPDKSPKTQLADAEAALTALENPPEGEAKGSPREIDAAAQSVIDLRAQTEGDA